jgi:hypothetical protein
VIRRPRGIRLVAAIPEVVQSDAGAPPNSLLTAPPRGPRPLKE